MSDYWYTIYVFGFGFVGGLVTFIVMVELFPRLIIRPEYLGDEE